MFGQVGRTNDLCVSVWVCGEYKRNQMKLYTTVVVLLISLSSQSLSAECDEFISWVAPSKDAYFRKNRIYPADEIIPNNPAPIYVQAFRDQNSADPDERWIFIKYNLVFDWSGLAAEIREELK